MNRILFIQIILLLNSCGGSQTERRSENKTKSYADSIYYFGNSIDTIKVVVRTVDSIKRVITLYNQNFYETIKNEDHDNIDPISEFVDINGNVLKVYSKKPDSLLHEFFSFDKIKFPIKVRTTWIDSAINIKNIIVNNRFIPFYFKNYNQNESPLGVTLQCINFDNDKEDERILRFDYYMTSTLAFLDKSGDDWYCIATDYYPNHISHPSISIIKSYPKMILVDYESAWGSGYFQQSIKLIKLEEGNLKILLDFVSSEGAYFLPFTLWEEFDSKITSINADSINVEYKYNLFSFKKDFDKVDVYILKNQKENINFKFNSISQKFEPFYSSNKVLLDQKKFSVSTFTELYKSKIDSIEKFGTERQKKPFHDAIKM